MKITLLIVGLAFLLALFQCAGAAETEGIFEGMDFLTGFGWGKLRVEHGGYRSISLMVDFNFSLKPLLKKFDINPGALMQLQVEPFLADIYDPDQNFETGATLWFKFGILPQTSKIQPYGKVGLGIDYMTLHTREQITQFNFTDQAALGLHYFFTKKTALTIEGRFRHLSNCGIKKPNRGINSYFGTTGLTYQF
jgi:hypothetical protein